MTSVFVLNPPGRSAEVAFDSAQALLAGRESDRADAEQDEEKSAGAPETLLVAGAAKVAEFSVQSDGNSTSAAGQPTAYERLTIQIAVVLAHTFVVLGLLYIGRRHFSSVQLGISMSCLYLLLPCTAYRVHELNHVLPAACLTWAFATYRKPALAGTFSWISMRYTVLHSIPAASLAGLLQKTRPHSICELAGSCGGSCNHYLCTDFF